MKIQYITTDFDFESTENISAIVEEVSEVLVPQLNQWVDGMYCVSLSGTGLPIFEEPEETINVFCDLIERLSPNSQGLWIRCTKRVADIGFESGSGSKYITYKLSEKLISRLERLKIELAITIYPINRYNIEIEEQT